MTSTETERVFRSSIEDLALAELTRLTEAKDELEGKLAEINESIRQVRAVLRVTTATKPGPKGARKRPSQSGQAFRLSAERQEEIEQYLANINGAEITATKLNEALPHWSASYCNMALKRLREDGVLRLSAMAGTQKVFKVV